MKEERAKAGLQLNIKKTKIMTTEELYNFSVDNEEIEIVGGFVSFGSIINPNGERSHEIRKRLRFGRAAIKEILKDNHV